MWTIELHKGKYWIFHPSGYFVAEVIDVAACELLVARMNEAVAH